MKGIILFLTAWLITCSVFAQTPEYKAVMSYTNGYLFWPANFWEINKTGIIAQTGFLTNSADSGAVSNWAQYVANTNVDMGTNSLILGGVPRTNWPSGGGEGGSVTGIDVTWNEGNTNYASVFNGTNLHISFRTNFLSGISVTLTNTDSNWSYIVDFTNIVIMINTNIGGVSSHTNLVDIDGDTNFQHITWQDKVYITNQTVMTGESGIHFRVEGGTTFVGYVAEP